jgi:hypothetical protein
MDWIQSSVANILAAVDAPLYDLGVLSPRGMLPGLNSIPTAAVLDRLSLLKRHNHRGAHIYFRPSGEHRFTVLDDLDQSALTRPSADGFNPCAVIQTSRGNFQAWLNTQARSPNGSVAKFGWSPDNGLNPNGAEHVRVLVASF